MSRRRPRSFAATVLAALAVVSVASAAAHCPPCHPDPLGTRILAGDGTLTSYAFAGDTVRVDYATRCAGKFIWHVPTAGPRTKVSPVCSPTSLASRVEFASRAPVATGGIYSVSAVPATAPDTPGRLEVRIGESGRLVHAWPLWNRPQTLSVDHGVAVFSAADNEGLYAMRLRDGQSAMIGVAKPYDRPLIGRVGVVYEDDTARYRRGPHGWLLKVIPRAAVDSALDAAGKPISTAGPIRAFAVDGPRVALAVGDLSGTCDRIVFWHIPWHFKSQITSGTEATCPPMHASGGITSVAIGNSRIEWVTRYGASTTVLAASTIACKEWVVTRLRSEPGGDSLGGVAGDRGVLAFALGRHERELRGASSLATVGGRWRARTIADGGGIPTAVSVDGNRIATLRQDGTVDVRRRDGSLVRELAPKAVSISLRDDRLVVLTREHTVAVYSVPTGAELGRWPTPAGTRPEIDVYYGVAVLTSGRTVYALDLATGRRVVIARAPTDVHAAIEAPGIVYVFNQSGQGHARFVPMRVIEALFAK
jgi:hypothetical protein